MKRTLMIAAAVLVVAAIGLGGLWYKSRGEIDRRIEAAKAAAEARGWTLTWSGREVQGFPFASGVLLNDVALVSVKGILIKAGDVRIAEDAETPGALAATFPAETSIEIPAGGLARETMPHLPARLRVAVASEDMRMIFRDTGDAEPAIVLAVHSLRAVIDQDDFPIKIALDATGLDAVSEPATDARKLRMKAASFGLDLRDLSSGSPSVLDSRYTDLQIGATVRASGLDEFTTRLAELAEKLVSGGFQSASQIITLSAFQAGSADGRPANLTWRAGPQTGIFEIDQGSLTYDSEDRDIEARVELPGTGAFGARALFYQRRVKLPIVSVGASARDGALRIAVEDFMPDEDTWKAFDPTGRFAREPADLLVDATATMYLTGGRGGALPAEFSNISLAALTLSALGATVSASGDVEILQPINLPLGEIKVAMTGMGALIDKLRGIGLLDEAKADEFDAMLKVFARPVEAEDRHETELTFTNDGMLVNGLTSTGERPGGAPPPADADAPSAGEMPADGAPADGTTPATGDGGTEGSETPPAGDGTERPSE